MASDGLSKRAKHGTCRMCLRVRNTEKYLKAVGEVRHGFATGHIWECIDIEDCDKAIKNILDNEVNGLKTARVQFAVSQGRFTEYVVAV